MSGWPCGGESWTGSFKVLEYRKPEFEVKAAADRQFLVAGDTGQIKVSGDPGIQKLIAQVIARHEDRARTRKVH